MPRVRNTRPTAIYWLYDTRPETIAARGPGGFPFYCGKTARGLAKRFYEHQSCAKRYPARKISVAILGCGQHVCFGAVEIVPAEQDWVARERYWIAILRQLNPNCVNVSDGGAGIPGMIHSTETRAKIAVANKGRPISTETRAKMRAIKIGKKQHPQHVENMRAATTGKSKSAAHVAALRAERENRTTEQQAALNAKLRAAWVRRRATGKVPDRLSEQHKARISSGLKGRIVSPVTCAKLSVALKGNACAKGNKHTDEVRQRISEAAKRQWTRYRESQTNAGGAT